jgi:hypothetical protein
VYEDEASDDSDTEIDEHIAALFDDWNQALMHPSFDLFDVQKIK